MVDPRQRMIEATIGLIEERGIGGVTVRGVAAVAEVNIAAVSYHFGSKQGLVAAALEGAIRHMVSDSEVILDRMRDDPDGGLRELLGYYLDGALRYPRVTKAQLHAPLVADDYTGPFPVLMEPVLSRLRDELRAAVDGLSKRAAAQRAIAALSAVYFPAFFGGLFRSLEALDSTTHRRRYVAHVAQGALAPLRPSHPSSDA